MINKEDIILEGKNAFLNLPEKDKTISDNLCFKLQPYQSGINENFWWHEGFSNASREYFWNKYKLNEFINKINSVCREYSVSMSFGCGCCVAGATVDNYEFSFNIKNNE